MIDGKKHVILRTVFVIFFFWKRCDNIEMFTKGIGIDSEQGITHTIRNTYKIYETVNARHSTTYGKTLHYL